MGISWEDQLLNDGNIMGESDNNMLYSSKNGETNGI